MSRSPWLPVLMLLALGVYLSPKHEVAVPPTPALPDLGLGSAPRATLPSSLPPASQALFKKLRPVSIKVEQRNASGTLNAIGTGFFISPDGQFLTAYHVVDGGKLFTVKTVSGQSFPATLVGFDNAADVALLKIRTRGQVPYVQLAAREPDPGEPVLAIGNSRDQFLQPRRGQLLRLNAQASRADFPAGTLEMSAPLAPGDSGGPIFDRAGQAIGVVSYIRVDQNDDTLASYAVPVTTASALLKDLKAGVKRDVPAIGIGPSRHDALVNVPGVVVGTVASGSPAARAGLRGERFVGSGDSARLVADVIVAVGGRPTRSFDDLLLQVRQKRIGDTVALTVLRGSQRLSLSVTLAAKGSINYPN